MDLDIISISQIGVSVLLNPMVIRLQHRGDVFMENYSLLLDVPVV